ncbi:UNVERIFIED_CONTAM: alkaline phosphatase [Acetivibrio alkalicellulosi]
MFKFKKGIIASLLVIIFITSCVFTAVMSNEFSFSNANNDYSGRMPKYVFLFIGDGMSYPQINSAEIYEGSLLYGDSMVNIRRLSFTEFPVEGVCTTFDAESFIPDSASTATSIASGKKTLGGIINMDTTRTSSFTPFPYLLKEEGYKIGIVSSVPIDHATPAAFYSSVPSRGDDYEIAVQLANSGFDYFGGGGIRRPRGRSGDLPCAIEMAINNGYTYVNTYEEILALNKESGKVIAVNPVLDSSSALPYELDRAEDDLSLADYTRLGIDLLYDEKGKGFFMMVESGKIDWACHANDAAASIHDTLAFERAINEAIEFYNKHPKDTLIIVTGDHECGGMTLGFAGTGYDTFYDKIAFQTMSYIEFDKIIEDYRSNTSREDATLEDLLPEIKAAFGLIMSTDEDAQNYPIMVLSDFEVQKLEDALVHTMTPRNQRQYTPNDRLLYGGYEPLSVTLTHILNNKAGIGWTSYSHTGLPLPVYAMGSGQEIFNGSYDNTDIYKKIVSIMNLNDQKPAKSDPTVSYVMTNDWGSGATINVTIHNNTDAPIDGWQLDWNFQGSQKITNMWNGQFTQTGANVTVTNNTYNRIIPANGFVTIGFNISYNGNIRVPRTFTLNGGPVNIEK